MGVIDQQNIVIGRILRHPDRNLRKAKRVQQIRQRGDPARCLVAGLGGDGELAQQAFLTQIGKHFDRANQIAVRQCRLGRRYRGGKAQNRRGVEAGQRKLAIECIHVPRGDPVFPRGLLRLPRGLCRAPDPEIGARTADGAGNPVRQLAEMRQRGLRPVKEVQRNPSG